MKKRRSNKPAAVQVAVAARRLAGQSKSRIAKDLAISRNTVAVILSEAELSSFIERSKKIIFEALEEIAKAYVKGAKQDYERAKDVCERLGIIPRKQDAAGSGNGNVFIGIGNLPRPEFGKPVLKEPTTVNGVVSSV